MPENSAFLKLSNLPPETQTTHRLHTFIERDDACKKAKVEAQAFCSVNRKHWFLTFTSGKTGTGKTHLAVGIGWEYYEGGYSIQYWQVAGMLNNLKESFDNPEKRETEWRMKWLKDAKLLVLDDLGAEKLTAWAAETLDFIIDYRYIHRKSTVFTTNLDPAVLSARVSSRLREGNIVPLATSDYRLLKGKKEVPA